MVTPYTEFRTLGNYNFLLAKAIDNRAGALVVMEVLKTLKNNPNQCVGAFIVQEEVGLRGAKTSTNKVKPQIAIAVDVGVSDDVPGDKNVSKKVLGQGPQLSFFDQGLIAHKGLRDYIMEIAQENKIPFQEPLPSGGTTEAASMHIQNEGASICSHLYSDQIYSFSRFYHPQRRHRKHNQTFSFIGAKIR